MARWGVRCGEGRAVVLWAHLGALLLQLIQRRAEIDHHGVVRILERKNLTVPALLLCGVRASCLLLRESTHPSFSGLKVANRTNEVGDESSLSGRCATPADSPHQERSPN
jgi:hypothetical protein